MSTTVIAIGLTLILIILSKLFFNFKNRRLYSLLKQFPSYPAYPLIGNLHMVCFSKNDLLVTIDKLSEPYDRAVFWVGPLPFLLLKNHGDILTMLNQSHDRDLYGFDTEWLGSGILNVNLEEWKKSRRILAPSFSALMLSKYTDTFNRVSFALVDKFKQAADSGEVIDVLEYLIRSNVDVIAGNALGGSTENLEKFKDGFAEAASETFKNIFERAVTPWLIPSFFYKLHLKISGKTNSIKHLHALPHIMIKNKIDSYKNEINQSDDDNSGSSKTITNQLLKGSRQESTFTEARMTNELRLMLVAAVETSSVASSFLMLMLAMHQDIQQKVYEEIAQLMADTDVLTADHLLTQLKYLEQCLKETIRLYSPIIATIRHTHEECVLTDKKIVPAGIPVALLIHWAQLDKELYESPMKWDPEHFSEQAVQNRPKNCFLGFGYGPRSCIGEKYAMMSMKAQVAYVLHNYHLSTNIKTFERSDLSTDLAIRSKIGYPIKFTSRDKMLKDINSNFNNK